MLTLSEDQTAQMKQLLTVVQRTRMALNEKLDTVLASLDELVETAQKAESSLKELEDRIRDDSLTEDGRSCSLCCRLSVLLYVRRATASCCVS